MRTSPSDGGFTLIELMIASMITLVVMGVAFSTFDNALALNEAATQISDSSQNLRAGTNLLIRDLMQTGRNLPIGGIAIPSGDGSTAIYRPGPANQTYTFDNTDATTITSITTGNGMGPTVKGNATDLVTILMDDPQLDPLTVYPSTTSGTVAKLAADGSSFNVGASTAWLAGNPAQGVSPIKVGDLIYFSAAGGTTIQTVTAVTTTVVTFGTDPFNFNQRGAEAGSITQILGSTMTARRIFMYTYFVYEETAGVPRLMRMLNMYPASALAGVIEDLDLDYDIVDGVNNPTDIAQLPYTANSVTSTASQIRKATVHVGVRSEFISTRTKDYLRNHLSTVVALRNLAYVDRYQ